jgi:hypothetical protein
LAIKTLDSELDPDPQLGKMLDPDPHKINAYPQPWFTCHRRLRIRTDFMSIRHPVLAFIEPVLGVKISQRRSFSFQPLL